MLNIGSGQPISLRYLVEELQCLLHSEVTVRYGTLPHREQEVWSIWANVARAKEILGWNSSTSLREGLRKTVEWLREQSPLYQNGLDEDNGHAPLAEPTERGKG